MLGNSITHDQIYENFTLIVRKVNKYFFGIIIVYKLRTMKKLLTIIAVFTVFTANSQSFGIKGDIGAGWAGIIPSNTWISGDTRFSYSAGVFSDIKIYKGLNFSPELLFTHAKINYQADITLTDQSGNALERTTVWTPVGYNYIELPLQIKLKDKRVYAVTGVSPMYTITGTKSSDLTRGNIPGSSSGWKITQDYSGFNLMYIIGAGFRINEKLSIDFKYNTSIMPIDDIGYRLNRFSAGVSYAIRN